MNFLFWNLNKKDLINELVVLSKEFDIDLIILAECSIPDSTVIRSLNANQERKYILPLNFSDNLKIYSRLNYESVKPVSDIGGVSIRRVFPPLGLDFILVAVHLPSKLHRRTTDQTLSSVRLSQEIHKVEIKFGHQRTIVIGDFNMNPFEEGIVSADGLHAVMDRYTAMKKQRIVQGETRKYFYNPMWSLLGDFSNGPIGTYHYSSSGQVCYYWNIFDQVLKQKTDGLLIGEVIQAQGGKTFTYIFRIVAPTLNNYNYELLTITHKIGFYPLTLVSSSGTQVFCSDENENKSALKEIFNHEQTQNTIVKLLTHIKSDGQG